MHTSIENQLTPRAGRREWLGLPVLVLPSLVVSVDLSVLFLALPKLAEDLLPGSTQQLWIWTSTDSCSRGSSSPWEPLATGWGAASCC